MPEGHTTHRLARDLTPLLVGRAVAVSSPQGRFAADAALVDGQPMVAIEAYGKHLFFHFASGLSTHVHLGLFGKFRVDGDGLPPLGEVRMRMRTDLGVVDLAGPTACEVGPGELRDSIVARLGPDPLRRDGRRADAIAALGSTRQPIGGALLDQRVIAGVGNVFRAEVLFVHGIHPTVRAADCDEPVLTAVWETLRKMLRAGVRDNRIITIDRRLLPRDRPLRRGDSTFVYKRDVCLRCGTAVQTVKLAGRPCYFCPACQAAP